MRYRSRDGSGPDDTPSPRDPVAEAAADLPYEDSVAEGEGVGPVSTGTTTVGLTTDDAVILAADKQATMNTHVADKDAEKIFDITEYAGITITGSVGDGQTVADLLEYEVRQYQHQHGKPISTQALAQRTGNLMRQVHPHLGLIMGGVDEEPQVYTIYPHGSVSPHDYVATGSGTQLATGVMESDYDPAMERDEAQALAVKAVKSAIERDVGTGYGVDVVTIDDTGTTTEFVPDEEIDDWLDEQLE